ncbi:MAG TPA: membrane protein insertase YidC [Chromatiales bacterium]|nr:membrane protein insertase YidC [Chromatiales bacterium]
MDNIRLILFFALAFILLMLYQAWVQDYGQTGSPAQPAPQQAADGAPAIEPDDVPVTPTVQSAPEATEVPATEAKAEMAEKVRVRTDVLDVEISALGGSLINTSLEKYAVDPKTPEIKFQLLKAAPPDLFLAQSGLIGADKESAPTHEALYKVEQNEYRLVDGKESLDVTLVWTGNEVEVKKHFIFTRGSYVVEIRHEIINSSGKPWAAREYSQFQRTPQSSGRSYLMAPSYFGGAIYSPEEKYEKIPFEDMHTEKLDRDVTGGWIAMLQHYFLGAWIPPADVTEHFYSNVLPGGRYVLGMYSPAVTVADGQSHTFSSRVFIGPKLQDQLEAVAPGLELTVDYGWLTIIAQPIFWVLNQLHKLTGNWGWSIILLTVLIKLAFYKLSETSYKSMAKMRKFTPRMQALKDRYGDDKARLNQAMMEMYKKEKINPLGGCLPILVQIPVFIALYWVLLESVELRHAPFTLWIDNLSDKDPYFILPLIMGVSMFVQQKLNPAPPDPMQAKIMMSLPFVFTVFFAFFPAGLVLYWVVNNLLSIAQQWYITRKIEQGAG